MNGRISHTSIYRYLHEDKRSGGDLYQHLARKLKPYRTNKLHDGRGQIANRKSIHDRPRVVNEKQRIGDWGIDTVMGKNHKQALVTIVDRVSGFVKIKKVFNKSAILVQQATVDLLKPIKLFVKTITADNGKEFAHHLSIGKLLNTVVYFADPYSSWQRGANGNTHGLIRQYLPKGSEFSSVTDEYVQEIEYALNNRPREMLHYRTPNQVFYNIR